MRLDLDNLNNIDESLSGFNAMKVIKRAKVELGVFDRIIDPFWLFMHDVWRRDFPTWGSYVQIIFCNLKNVPPEFVRIIF